MGTDPIVRQQTFGVLLSAATYVLYGGIAAAQVAMDLVDPRVALWIIGVALVFNVGVYALVRSGRVRRGRDPGLSRTQLIVGILFMFPAYAAAGPAATGQLVVMASHVVYSMFMLRPRQVWLLVALTLLGLALTMLLCGWLWPERYAAEVQVSGLLYAMLVMPLIAVLAHRVTGMTKRLKTQQAELQAALARLQELATRDELTRTHNRRHLAEQMRVMQSTARRQGTPLALALIDIDHFKQVNDRHGHGVGDEVLKGFAAVAQDSLRAADLLGRWGGEEFIFLMPHTTRADGVGAMERLQQRLAAQAATAMPLGLSVTFSAGVVEIGPDESPDAAVERADQAMYRAKLAGRCRCEAG
jgi:diguanylate cyclase (GGDEF)-like protein